MKAWRDSLGAVLPARSGFALFAWFLLFSFLLFQRPLGSNFIFDEQEALLKNPFLRADVSAWRVFRVDFWGRDPAHTIGSYRPLPVMLWKLLAPSLHTHTPLVFICCNLLAHAASGVLLARIVSRVLLDDQGSLRHQRCLEEPWPTRYGQVAGLVFVVHGLVTETVCYAVGLADALMALFSLCMVDCILSVLEPRGVGWRAILGRLLVWLLLGASLFLGLLCKETMVGMLVAAPMLALLLAHTQRASRLKHGMLALLRATLVGGTSLLSFVGYVMLRKAFFPAASLDPSSPMYPRAAISWWSSLMDWLALPPIPNDALNNPLITASLAQRWPTTSALWLRQTWQMLVPWPLVSDYSFPSELPRGWGVVPATGVFCLLALLSYLAVLFVRQAKMFIGRGRAHRAWERLLGLGVVVWLCSYAPVSNTLFLLPTIRGERLLYLPLLGFVVTMLGVVGLLAPHVRRLWRRALHRRGARVLARGAGALYLISLGAAGRMHAFTYENDLAFWSAAAHAPRPSAKSYLNLGIMLGARGDLDGRLYWTRRALELAPDWPMAHVYLGDVWCRKRDLRAAEAPYLSGLKLAVNNKDLTALALQCIWDSGSYPDYRLRLHALTNPEENTWLRYFLFELDEHGKEHSGIAEQYRPLGYNRAPL